ncbi:MAG: hypothetical protein COB50_01300 [Thiotrichales bacterium]|nr:MAG: hypothetical protein COB50_01300 [Thiotrichales bacterium]
MSNQTQVIDSHDLPLSCPLPEMELWDSHPRVFLPIEESADQKIACPYCGTKYELKQD